MIIGSDKAFCQILGPFHGPLSHLTKLMSKGTSQEALEYHEYDNLLHWNEVSETYRINLCKKYILQFGPFPIAMLVYRSVGLGWIYLAP